MSVKLLWVAVVLLGLALTWTQWRADPVVTPSAANAPPEKDDSELLERIEALEAELTHELLQRQRLEHRLARLEESPHLQSSKDNTGGDESITSEIADTSRVPANHRQQESSSLRENLLSAGLASETIQSIQQRIDDNRLEMLELRNSAIREGWNESEEFVEKMQEMSDPTRGLREEFGDLVYDQYLYASGRSNRIQVREVYSGSAAANAGIQPGDIVTAYASNNIYSMSELRQSTVEGIAGENVLVEVLRDGMPITTTITRGPMGISMSTTRIQP